MSAVGATALLLTSCGIGTGSDAGQESSETIPSSIGAPSSTTATASTPTQPASGSSTPSSPSTPPSSAPATSSAPTTPRILDFKGIHLLLPVEKTDLPGIPDSLRTALAAGLQKRWDAYGDVPQCEKGPVYVVNKVDTGGWASIDSWDDPSVTGPKCAGVGGGYDGFWAQVGGTWREVIRTQELPQCEQFTKYHFPVAIVGDKCARPDGTEVDYQG